MDFTKIRTSKGEKKTSKEVLRKKKVDGTSQRIENEKRIKKLYSESDKIGAIKVKRIK